MKNRALHLIANEIRATLKREVADVIKIGRLLAEAQAQLDHGEWMPWLEQEFSLSDRSARRYVATYEFTKSAKLAKSASSKLGVSALFLLAEQHLEPEEVKAVLKAARKQWIGATKAWDIIQELRWRDQPPPPEPPQGAEPPSSETPPEPPPPWAPPPPAPLPLDVYLTNEFTTAISTLMKLITKPSSKFVGVAQVDDLRMLANFLNGIAAAQSKPKPTDNAA
jgi:hypothetical protein